jgi:hypothetical protein
MLHYIIKVRSLDGKLEGIDSVVIAQTTSTKERAAKRSTN